MIVFLCIALASASTHPVHCMPPRHTRVEPEPQQETQIRPTWNGLPVLNLGLASRPSSAPVPRAPAAVAPVHEGRPGQCIESTGSRARMPPPLDLGFASRPRAVSTALAISRPQMLATTPQSTAIVPARTDGTVVQPYGKGSKRKALEIARDPTQRTSAADELSERVYARSNTTPHQNKLLTWKEVAQAAGHADAYALDVNMLYDTAAALWKANFRSLDCYLRAVKMEMTLAHGNLPESMIIHFKRVARAAARGRGPPKHATELPFARLTEIEDTEQPLTTGGPCYPRRMTIIASWWMLREIEAANLTLDCITITSDTARVLLPASKTDKEGRGTSRSLACTCESALAALCPYHALKAQAEWAFDHASLAAHVRGSPPLFPATHGGACAKRHTSETVMAIAAALGLPLGGVGVVELLKGRAGGGAILLELATAQRAPTSPRGVVAPRPLVRVAARL